MSFYNQPSPGWHAYHQNQWDYIQQDNYQHPDNKNKLMYQGTEPQSQGANKYGAEKLSGNNAFPVQDANRHGPGNNHYNTYSTYPANTYYGVTPDMQSMVQMMTQLRNQLDQLNQLIIQNNRLLQSIHDQEDTKCVQGSGGGAVIVRM